MNTLRNWLLGIVRQAIREEYPRERVAFVKVGGTRYPTLIQVPVSIQTTAEYTQPSMSFEQLQDESLNAQEAYWERKQPSDV